jgi:uncharacterized membrane protein
LSERSVRTSDNRGPFRRVDEPTSKRGGRVSPWLLATVALAVLLGVFFRVYGLDHKVFWEDEILGTLHMQGYTEADVVEASPRLVNAAAVQRYLRAPSSDEHRPLAATIRSLAIEDPLHPPLYYLAGRLWEQVFGSSAAAIRSLSAVFGVLTLPCLYWFCLELFGSSETALVAVALVAVSPFYVLYAQEARPYSLWTVAILLDALLFMRASRSTAPAPWIAYAALTALGLYVYPLTGLVALGFGAYLLVRERCRLTSVVIAWAVATLAALASFVPWLAALASSRGVERGLSGVVREKLSPAAIALLFSRDLRYPFFDLGQFRIGGLSSTAVNLLLTVVAVALCAYALAVLVRDRPFAVWGFIVIALCLPMTALLLIDLFVRGHFVYQARYFIPLLLGVQLSVAALFAAAILGKAAGGGARRAARALRFCHGGRGAVLRRWRSGGYLVEQGLRAQPLGRRDRQPLAKTHRHQRLLCPEHPGAELLSRSRRPAPAQPEVRAVHGSPNHAFQPRPRRRRLRHSLRAATRRRAERGTLPVDRPSAVSGPPGSAQHVSFNLSAFVLPYSTHRQSRNSPAQFLRMSMHQ